MNPQMGSFISMDTYQRNAYDPASLHKYTYAQNNPEMYHDPSGHFIGVIGSSISTACSEILRNSQALHVMGMVSGMMNTIINQTLGGEDDPGTAFIKGYLAGFGFGAVYYGALAIAAVYELTAIVHLGFFTYLQGISLYQLTLALSCRRGK